MNFGSANKKPSVHWSDDDDDEAGLLPETYLEPDFPILGKGNIEFEGQQPDSFGPGVSAGSFGSAVSDTKRRNPEKDMNFHGEHIPSLKPNERNGSCQPYIGSVCSKYVGNEYVFVTEGLTQLYIEQKLQAAFTVISASPELSQSCSQYAIPSICVSTFPLCDRQTERPRKICREECEVLENSLCRKELAIARQYALLDGQLVLPECQKLPAIGSRESSNCVRLGLPQVREKTGFEKRSFLCEEYYY